MIQALNISKTFQTGAGVVQVLSGVSFSLAAGKMMVIKGKSGSGKTTLLNCLGGIDRPDSGDVSCFGTSIHELTETGCSLFQRKNLGFIFQSGNLLSYLSVGENISFPLVLNGYGKKKRQGRVSELMGNLGLDMPESAMPHELSGGQAQRVAFARAVAHFPKLLLADEPTASLDTQTGLDLVRLMRRVGKENKTTIIVSTHDRGILQYADLTLDLVDGKIK